MADDKKPNLFERIFMGRPADAEEAKDQEEELHQVTFELNARFQTILLRKQLDLLQSSLPFVSNRIEKKRRLRLVQKICVARDQLEKEGFRMGLNFVDQALEAVIAGDWVECRELSRLVFTYDQESDDLSEIYNEKHRIFRELLLEAHEKALPSDPMELTVQKGGAWGKNESS